MLVTQSCPTPCDPMDCSPPGFSVHGKNTEVGCHFLLQRISLIQESNPGLLHRRQILYGLSHKGRLLLCRGFPGDTDSKQSACSVGGLGSSPSLEDHLEKGIAVNSSIFAWRIPWAEEPGRLQCDYVFFLDHAFFSLPPAFYWTDRIVFLSGLSIFVNILF